jgi:hypothetical protein
MRKVRMVGISAVTMLLVLTVSPMAMSAQAIWAEDVINSVITVIGIAGGHATEGASIATHVAGMGPDVARSIIAEKARQKAINDLMNDIYPQ